MPDGVTSSEPNAENYVENYVEPWMRGPIADLHPLLAPPIYSFRHALEDLTKWTAGLTEEQLWARPHGTGSVGFHIQHIAGSTDRLMTYLQAKQLSAGQLAVLKSEHEAGPTKEALLESLRIVFQQAESLIRAIDPSTLSEPRGVGRKHLPTTVIGLLTHIAEHTQRHVGEAILTVKWVRAASNSPLG